MRTLANSSDLPSPGIQHIFSLNLQRTKYENLRLLRSHVALFR